MFCYFVLHISLSESFLIGSLISSTDAASVFSILRSKRLNLKYHTACLLYTSKIRAERIGKFTDSLSLLCETNLDIIGEIVKREMPEIVVIDSIQTMYNENVASAPGSVSQVRESTGTLMQMAKGLGIAFFIIGHVTKEGVVAGPRVLEHMVDTVLYFEGDRHAAYRILRGVKNRFGSTNEIGVFEMRSAGLKEVENLSLIHI